MNALSSPCRPSPFPILPRRAVRIAVAAGCAVLATTLLAGGTLEQDFAAPPQAARPYVWWHWLSHSISTNGVDRDIAAMKESGIGGALITNIASLPSQGGMKIGNPPWPGMTYGTEPWWQLMKRAIASGHAAGLDMGMVNCPGWAVSGGPWITPDRSMQRLVWTQTRFAGPGRYAGEPPRPKVNPQWNYYRDVAILAVPDRPDATAADVVRLESQRRPDGTLDWQAPPGNWTIFRFGQTTTGRMTNPLPDGVESLECDKLSAEASAFHIEHLLATLREHLGPMVGRELRHMHFDSYEAGPADWTAALPAQFRSLRGYDPIPWLPVLAGRTLGGPELSGRFEWDMRQTLSDMFVRNNLVTMAALLRKAGIRMSLEPYTGPFDTIAATSACELPMSEFWSNPSSWLKTRMDRHDEITRKVTASAQAAGFRIVCAEASTGFPMDSRWTEHPGFLKASIDSAMVGGINQFQLHSWVHQPFGDDVKPGLTLSWWGTHFGRNQTWFEPGKAYFAYLARCAALLQHGFVVSDLCTAGFVADEGDAISTEQLLQCRTEDGRIVVPSGRRYAAILLPPDTRAMLPATAAKVKELVEGGATIVGPKPLESPSLEGYPQNDRAVAALGEEVWGGVDGITTRQNRYGKGRVIWGCSTREVLSALGVPPDFAAECADPSRIRALHRSDDDTDLYFVVNAAAEATDAILSFRVTGRIPEIWRPLTGSHDEAALWRTHDSHTRLPLRMAPGEALFVVFRRPARNSDPVRCIVRTQEFHTPGNTLGLHFLADDTYAAFSTDAVANTPGGIPSAWRSGGAVHLRTSMPGRYSLVFESGRTAESDAVAIPPAQEIAGGWRVVFDDHAHPDASADMKQLTSWSDSPDPSIRYFSGTATYRRRIAITADRLAQGRRLMLDLGTVHDLARVRVNGKDLGVVWTEPFTVDITDAAREGDNDLEIAVTNTWHNRLIGDEQEPADIEWGPERTFRRVIPTGRPLARFPDWIVNSTPRPSKGRHTFVSWNYFKPDSPLIPAGLLGPVLLRSQAEIVFQTP